MWLERAPAVSRDQWFGSKIAHELPEKTVAKDFHMSMFSGPTH